MPVHTRMAILALFFFTFSFAAAIGGSGTCVRAQDFPTPVNDIVHWSY